MALTDKNLLYCSAMFGDNFCALYNFASNSWTNLYTNGTQSHYAMSGEGLLPATWLQFFPPKKCERVNTRRKLEPRCLKRSIF
jgi:hypothetical protein